MEKTAKTDGNKTGQRNIIKLLLSHSKELGQKKERKMAEKHLSHH